MKIFYRCIFGQGSPKSTWNFGNDPDPESAYGLLDRIRLGGGLHSLYIKYNNSSAVAEMAARCCTTRTVKPFPRNRGVFVNSGVPLISALVPDKL